MAAGTCAEYDWSFGYCREDTTPLAPASLYGTAKDASRRLLEAVCGSYQVPFAWGRIFMPYGRGEDNRRLMPSLIKVFRGQRPTFGVNASAYRDFVHAEDVARSFIKLLLSDAVGDYNISSGQPTQIAEVVRLIAKAFNADPGIVLDQSTERPGEPDLLIGNNTRLKSLGWQATNSMASLVASLDL